MTDLDADKPAADWHHKTNLDRIHACAAMLNIHGFLTDAERKKVHERMLKWAKKPDTKGK